MGVTELAMRTSVGWLEGASDPDVVLSARVRLSRNLADHPYPGADPHPVGGCAAAEAVVRAIRDELTPEPLGVDSLDLEPPSMTADERGLLAERSLMDDAIPAELFVARNELLVVSVGAIDHLRIAAFAPGLRLQEALARARAADQALERRLNYAVSLDWGYLSTQVTNLGTALRASILLHLPALSLLGRLPELRDGLAPGGLELVTLLRQEALGSVSGGALCLLRNRLTLGPAESAILAELEEQAKALVHYERAGRQEIRQARGAEIADSAYRALGILSHARSLSAVEARSLLSHLRFGVVTGLVGGVAAERVTALLVLTQDSHVAQRLAARRRERGEVEQNTVRAELVREALAA